MEEINSAVSKHYGVARSADRVSIKPIDAGFLSTNYKVTVGSSTYFLKGYVKGTDRVRTIHMVKQHFASHGIPVILPLLTDAGDTMFTVGEKVYALFPFVDGIHHNRQHIPEHVAVEIARVVASMHRIAAEHPLEIPARLKLWNDADALAKIDELLQIVRKVSAPTDFDRLALMNLELKRRLVSNASVPPESCITEPWILIHGDFHEQNLFFDESGNIKYVFDFGEVKMGPRAHELWRSSDYMFINGIYSEENVAKAILYLKTYNALNPIKREDLVSGFEIYFQMQIHSVWVESEHYLKGNTRVDRFLETRATGYLAEHRKEFLERVLRGVYGE